MYICVHSTVVLYDASCLSVSSQRSQLLMYVNQKLVQLQNYHQLYIYTCAWYL